MAPESLESVFRQSSGVVHAALNRLFGPSQLDIVETTMQEAFIKAMEIWPREGIPASPQAWLIQVAKNLALDHVRRETRFNELTPEIEGWMRGYDATVPDQEQVVFARELEDEELRMMFACCHPDLSTESQISLILNTLCGFDPRAVSRAFMIAEPAAAKRLVRAKQSLREQGIHFDFPPPDEVSQRLDAVLRTIYLLFSEGYSASSGDLLMKEELCHDALRFGAILARHPATDTPPTHALLALMLFQTARLKGRVDSEGTPVILEDQDRAQWDRALIDRGIMELSRSGIGESLTSYHLEAAIAACHARAKTWEETDWSRIVSLYGELLILMPNPIVALNRAIAFGMLHGPDSGLGELKKLEQDSVLRDYHLFHASCAEFQHRAGRVAEASASFKRALALAPTEPERRFLERKISSLT